MGILTYCYYLKLLLYLQLLNYYYSDPAKSSYPFSLSQYVTYKFEIPPQSNVDQLNPEDLWWSVCLTDRGTAVTVPFSTCMTNTEIRPLVLKWDIYFKFCHIVLKVYLKFEFLTLSLIFDHCVALKLRQPNTGQFNSCLENGLCATHIVGRQKWPKETTAIAHPLPRRSSCW